MNRIKSIIYIASILLLSLSCSKWLDVEPNSQIKSSELLRTEAGFKEALAGVYTLMTEERLYGKELQYGMMGVLSHEWSNYSTTYNEDGNYNYEATTVQTRMNNVWNGMYTAITNANNIIANIDERKNVFSGDNFNIIKGEAYALRGFLHFELLRLFGTSYLLEPNKPAIPYVTRYTALQTRQSTVREVLDMVVADLKIALDLLKSDPIYTGREVSEIDDNGYLLNRQLHLNYYAVEGVLARAYLYAGENQLARNHADNVIESGQFTFTTQANFISESNFTSATEHLFGLQINDLHQRAITYLSQEGTSVLSLNANILTNYYESNTDDYRFLYLFRNGTGVNADSRYLLKYTEPTSTQMYYRNKSTVIKLSEMYFIKAICNLRESASILAPINEVRRARGISALSVEPVDATETLISEFRKEFFGEGQLFHLYKLINRRFVFGSDKDLVGLKAYIFPLPVAEYDAADRQNNR